MDVHKGPWELDSPRSFDPRRGAFPPFGAFFFAVEPYYFTPTDRLGPHSSTELAELEFLGVGQISRVKAGHFWKAAKHMYVRWSGEAMSVFASC